jgi:hypothetical protein
MTYSVRPLTSEHAEAARELRLASLLEYGELLANYYALEKAKPVEYWREVCTERPHCCWFGIFEDGRLIGIQSARLRWERARVPALEGDR